MQMCLDNWFPSLVSLQGYNTCESCFGKSKYVSVCCRNCLVGGLLSNFLLSRAKNLILLSKCNYLYMVPIIMVSKIVISLGRCKCMPKSHHLCKLLFCLVKAGCFEILACACIFATCVALYFCIINCPQIH